jgi:hypothetical protein
MVFGTTADFFWAIYPGYVSDSEPEFCKMCNKCDNVLTSISICHYQGSKPSNFVFTPVFPVAVLSVIFFFSCIGLIKCAVANTEATVFSSQRDIGWQSSCLFMRKNRCKKCWNDGDENKKCLNYFASACALELHGCPVEDIIVVV